MIPLRLQLKNFMSYRGGDTDIDFNGIHLACLAGDNGHGKSALLDAITWALWGKSRARYDDDLITRGETEMEVRFEFELAGQRYRVVRQRSSQGRGSTVLELQAYNGNTFVPMGEPKVRETEARINELLKVDYETFINSAFILQGRADEFTTKRPGERKRILADILGLGVYDVFEDRAKEKAREAEQKVQVLAHELEELKKHASLIEQYEQEAAEAEERAAQVQEQLEVAEKEYRELREQYRVLESKAEQLTGLERDIRQVQSEIEKQEKRRAHLQDKIATNEALIEREDEIKAAFEELQAARQEVERWNEKVHQLMELQEERGVVQRNIDAARSELESDLKVQKDRVADLERRLSSLVEAEKQRDEAKAKLEEFAQLEEQRNEWQAEREEAIQERASRQQENEHMRQQMNDIKERMDLLTQEEGAECPVCRRPLSEEHRKQALEEAQVEGKQMGDRHRENQAAMKELAGTVSQLEQKVAKAERDLRQRRGWEQKLARAEQQLEQAKDSRKRLTEAREKVEMLQARLDEKDYAREAQARLEELDHEASELGYDKEAHEAAKQRVTSLQPAEEDMQGLKNARERLSDDRENLDLLNSHLETLETRLSSLNDQREELFEELEGRDELRADVQKMGAEVTTLQKQSAEAQRDQGAAKQRLDFARKQAEKLPAKKEARDRWIERREAFQELRQAFGKRGLQAMIIEASLPELEDEANRLLSMMTNGRMSVRLESQRETKRGSMLETLDIVIADEQGARPYELYSGGEALRVNFALRIALSKLLARRAGARLQTLFIDEGFGSQDANGRERLVEAINAIQEEFARVFVITHIDELKEYFPARIDVVKDGAGSHVYVNV